MKNYAPKPIDTEDVEVGEDILELAEKLAENTHEVWAVGKLAEGWEYGDKLDCENKTHPLLVPYSELSESDKDYDRRTSLETLKLLIKLGYKIEKE